MRNFEPSEHRIKRARMGYFYPCELTFYKEWDEPENSLYFGIELETGFTHGGFEIEDFVKDLPEQLFCISDCSIRDNHNVTLDIEVVSHPMTYHYLKAHPKIWQYIFDWKARGLKAYSLHSCGMHIHLSKDKFTPGQIINLILLFHDNRDLFYRLSQRKQSELGMWAEIPEWYSRSDFVTRLNQDLSPFRCTKTKAINVKDDTVEIRLFNSVLNPKSFYKNVEFCRLCYEYTLENQEIPFLEYITQNALFCPNLMAFLHYKGIL